jgi:PHD/YefM family antitoxin component YafN of YafNO toxin-antitoxin module
MSLVSEEDWNAISETVNLLSIPGMRESIREGMETPPSECAEDLDW